MTQEQFAQRVAELTSTIAGRPLDAALEAELNSRCGAGSETFLRIQDACRAGIDSGWMCSREGGGIRYGRVVKPTPATHGFRVDVVEMADIVGPQHAHPNGEIDLVMPLDADARFDDRGAGWMVYGPGSAHSPTVTRGRAWVLYLLPGGAIEFSKA